MKTENSASHCEYYHAPVTHPSNPGQSEPYVANCEDIIQALGLTFDEGCEFKSIWRRGRGRQGFVKAESTALRDAQKAVHYAGRVLALELRKPPQDRIDTTCLGSAVATMHNWDGVSEDLLWMAKDPNGEVWGYTGEPFLTPTGWDAQGDQEGYNLRDRSLPHVHWRDSLEKRR